jgi:Asp/Glu/hydantoin racemase
VPVFSSSLLQVHLAQALIRRNQKIGIITARRSSLTDAHLAGVGIQHYPSAIIGMEHAPEFSAVFIGGKATLDQGQCHREMQAAAEHLMREHPEVGVIVLECTNMPPFANTVRRATGLPVFDVVTMVNHAHSLLTSG